MHTLRWASLLCALFLMPLPQQAMANTLKLSLTGVASQDFQDALFDPSMSSPTTNFAGQRVTINLAISDPGGVPAMTGFSVMWSDQTFALPVMTSFEGSGAPGRFLSQITLTNAGGTIGITPSPTYIGVNDGYFDINLDYATSAPHSPTSSFTDTATGGGSLSGFVQFPNNPTFGYFDNTVTGDFTLTSVVASVVPEPSAWTMMILGVAMIGFAARRWAKVMTSAA